VRALIDKVIAFLDEHLAAGDGSFLEGVPASVPRRQNPHMHLFEALLALHETIAHPQALERAARLRALLTEKFMDAASGTLGEYFDAEWRPWRNSEPIEPGHHAEWSWLLRRHERLASLSADPIADHLRKMATRFGDQLTGLLPDGVLSDGTEPTRTHRCWPQCEFAKAWLAEHERGGSGADIAAGRALEILPRYYLANAVAGGWIDRVTPSGEPLVDHIPASTFYHLFSAIAEADRLLGS
jgi:mannose-6-phosphate isomerase